MYPSLWNRQLLIGVAAIVASASAYTAESSYRITSLPIKSLSSAGQNLATTYFKVEQWGFANTSTSLFHDVWFYPTANDRNEAGIFTIDAHKANRGDFDGDGDQDMLINWTPMPFTVAHETITPSVLLNQGGQLSVSTSIWQSDPPDRIFAYKIHVQDFNLDGRDDAVSATMGRHTRLEDGTFDFSYEPIPLIMSTNDGLVDATTRIKGQEQGLLAGFSFAHDLAAGDVNGDGIADFYEGRNLFIGDGNGSFEPRNDLLPVEASTSGSYPHFVMSSAIGDLDNDGIGDLVIGLADGQIVNPHQSGWIFLSDNSGSLANGRTVPLPVGLFGLENTKHNSMTMADVNADGRLDILIGQTRANPYYSSRKIQLLINLGDGIFVDESVIRLVESDRPHAHGEGPVQVMDINGDGYIDIVDSAAGKATDVAILVNDGTGHFHRMPTDLLPVVQNYHIAGWENQQGESYGISNTSKIYPIDLDGNGIISFVVQMQLPPARWPPQQGDLSESILYVVRGIAPYMPVSGPKQLSDWECVLRWASRSAPDLFPGTDTTDGKLEGYQYRRFIDANSVIAIRGRHLFALAPAISNDIINVGGIDRLLPAARSTSCQ